MGFLKDSFQVLRSDELKELKRRADAQPRVSMLEGVRMANQAAAQADMWQAQAAGNPMMDMTAATGMYSAGIAGTATVTALADSGMQINGAPVMDIDLQVVVPGREPYPVRHRQLVAFAALANFQPGKSFPVRVDQGDPTKLVIG
jgi:hypothetical protein